MASRGQGAAGGRGNPERDDRGKRPMVDPDLIREPVEETFEEEELAPIIMGQPTSPSTRGQGGLEVEGTVIGTTGASALWATDSTFNTSGSWEGEQRWVEEEEEEEKMVSKESHEASRARSEVNHHIRHAWFKWFAENAEHRNTFKLYNTPGTSMGVRRLLEHLCELGRQTYEGRREIAPALPPFDTAIKTRMELWAESFPYKLMDEYKIWIKNKVFKDWSDASYQRMGGGVVTYQLLVTDISKTS
ncbi:hypothetical protein R1sor_011108 [Riccia sorocarpa]|uniref:Uncharacterized protein n=1 Tax=Riccia sorocarpa TaxID=122646 RepID=A0ABD3I3N9_9MARC